MGVPGWLLKLVMAFLRNREMILRHRGHESRRETLPGGGPQGTKLGLYPFIILINAAGMKDVDRNIGNTITKPLNKREPILTAQEKYVDDMTQSAAVDLKKCAVLDPNPSPPLPPNYHDRTGHTLPIEFNILQTELDQLIKYTEEHQMKLNQDKTKVMIFNQARTCDVMPKLSTRGDAENLEVVEEMKLLGVMIRSDLSWSTHTQYLTKKGFSRLWILRNLKRNGAQKTELLDIYIKMIRSVMEMASPVWNPGLTQGKEYELERVQKIALAIIMGPQYTSYNDAMVHCNLLSLATRRTDLCLNFIKKCYKSPKFSQRFQKNDQTVVNTRSTKYPLKSVPSRTVRYAKSSLPYLTDLLNRELYEQAENIMDVSL